MCSVSAGRPFLSARWLDLVMLNWRVPAAMLEPLAPAGTTLDCWNGEHYVSVIGFRFADTRMLGVPIPFHRNFLEVNLRFYVKRIMDGEVRRGVCFLRELVPRRAIALTARLLYNEPYRAVRMSHRIEPHEMAAERSLVEYSWQQAGQWSRISVAPAGAPLPPAAGSLEEFITEHYWGYTRQRDGGTVEYRVTHPRWRIWQVSRPTFEGDPAATYGSEFGEVLARSPDSAFLADGSDIAVFMPVRLKPSMP